MFQVASSAVSSGSDVVVAICALLTLVALAAVVVVFARANYAKVQIEALRGDRDDLNQRCDRLEEDNARITSELRDEKSARQTLERVVTGKEELAQLLQTVKRIAEKVGVVND